MRRFLQIPDIHSLFCEDTEDEYVQMCMRFIEDLKKTKAQFGVVDYALMCGEVACKGQKSEFNKAKLFVKLVSRAQLVENFGKDAAAVLRWCNNHA